MSKPKIAVVMPVWAEMEWQYHMTVAAIRTLFCTTDIPFHMVIAERGAELGDFAHRQPNRYHHIVTNEGSVNADTNLGFEYAAESLMADYIVYTGNDLFARPGWLEALLECFEHECCGAATLAYSAGDRQIPAKDQIVEAIYGPFMMFPASWRFDAETFPHTFGDTDLIMRIYRDGKRQLMNRRVQVHHFSHSTLGHGDFDEARQRFIEKHKDCPIQQYFGLAGIQI